MVSLDVPQPFLGLSCLSINMAQMDRDRTVIILAVHLSM